MAFWECLFYFHLISFFFLPIPANKQISECGQNAYCRDTNTWDWIECLEEIAAKARENELERERRRQETRAVVKFEEAFWASIGEKDHSANWRRYRCSFGRFCEKWFVLGIQLFIQKIHYSIKAIFFNFKAFILPPIPSKHIWIYHLVISYCNKHCFRVKCPGNTKLMTLSYTKIYLICNQLLRLKWIFGLCVRIWKPLLFQNQRELAKWLIAASNRLCCLQSSYYIFERMKKKNKKHIVSINK